MKWPRIVRNEWYRLFARPRTYMGFSVFCATEWLVLALLHTKSAQAQMGNAMSGLGLDVDQYFSGLTMAVIIMIVSYQFMAQLFLSLVGGDIVAKDVEDGTMRMALCRPVSRFEVLSAKWVATLAYAVVLVTFMGLTSLLSGLIVRGAGGLFLVSPIDHSLAFFSMGAGLKRYALSLIIIFFSAGAIVSLAFMFSCFPFKPSTATVLTLAVIFSDYILSNLPYLQPFRELFLHYQLSCWMRVFQEVIPWWVIGSALCYLTAFSVTAFIIGTTAFAVRDLK